MLQANPLTPPAVGLNAISESALRSIIDRERVSDRYWTYKDRLNEMRIWWRGCTVRHLLHVLPRETILELGCDSGTLTRGSRGSRGQRTRSRRRPSPRRIPRRGSPRRRRRSNGRAIPTTYDPTPRVGDHICYITNLAKLRSHYPGWDLTYNLDDIVESVYKTATRELQSQPA